MNSDQAMTESLRTAEKVLECLVVMRAARVPLHPGHSLGEHAAHGADGDEDAAADAVEGRRMVLEAVGEVHAEYAGGQGTCPNRDHAHLQRVVHYSDFASRALRVGRGRH